MWLLACLALLPDPVRLSQLLQAAVDRGDVAGVVALVADKDRVLYHQAFGKLDVARSQPMPKDAIFRIASMTKPITSALALMLIEEGKLRLDDPVANYLPAFREKRVIVSCDEKDCRTRPAARTVTVRHLLTHTSGIGYAWSDPYLKMLQEKTGLPEADLPLLHDPGARWTYGAGTRVLGAIVEKVSGRPLEVLMRERILEPLGMNDTSYAVPPEKAGRVPTVHQRAGGVLREKPNPAELRSAVRGDSNLYSTATDYSRFLQLLLNGGRGIVSSAALRQMMQNQIGELVVERQAVASDFSRPYPLGAGVDKWSLAFQVAASEPAAHRRSPGSVSWAGIFNTHFWVDPKRQVAAVLLVQLLPFYDDRAIALLSAFEEQIYE